MKNRAQSIALGWIRTASRRAFLAIALTGVGVIVVGTGAWAHKIYADEEQEKKVAQERAATVSDVMAKLNKIESEMQEQTQAVKQKMDSLEYQNVKLAEYLTRERSRSARLELAAAREPRPVAIPSPALTTSPLVIETKVCHHVGMGAAGKLGLDAKLDGEAKGGVGAEAFGNGVDTDAKGGIEVAAGLDLEGESKFEVERCLNLSEFNPFGATPSADVAAFVSSLTTGSTDVANKLVENFPKFKQLTNSAATDGIDALNALNVSFSPQQILQSIENPSSALQPVSGLLQSIPLPGNVSNFLQDPSSIFPKPSDLDPANFCANVSPTTGGLVSTFCTKIPSSLPNLTGITNTIGQFTNVQADLGKIKTGITQLCGSVNGTVTTLNNTHVTVPQLAAFTFVDGINFGIPPSFSTRTISVGPQTIGNPIQLQPLPCPTF